MFTALFKSTSSIGRSAHRGTRPGLVRAAFPALHPLVAPGRRS